MFPAFVKSKTLSPGYIGSSAECVGDQGRMVLKHDRICAGFASDFALWASSDRSRVPSASNSRAVRFRLRLRLRRTGRGRGVFKSRPLGAAWCDTTHSNRQASGLFAANGEGGIRTRGRPLKAYNGLAKGRPNQTNEAQSTDSSGTCDGSDNLAESVLARRLAFLVQEDADLAAIVEAWPTLPGPVKAGIVAMVNVAGGKGVDSTSASRHKF